MKEKLRIQYITAHSQFEREEKRREKVLFMKNDRHFFFNLAVVRSGLFLIGIYFVQ